MSEWEKNVRKVIPYVPGEQPKTGNKIKLNTNENPYPPSPLVKKTLGEFNSDALRLYPDPAVSDLVSCIADYCNVSPSNVFVGVGSDDVLAMCFLTFFNSQKPILFPDITYSFYDVWADLFKIKYRAVPLDDGFGIRSGDYLSENGGIIFPNPNAPTGLEMPIGEIEEIAAKNPGSIVIVDEAYVDFGAASAIFLTEKYENLLVVQTFSKSRSMAGMRIGFAVGSEKLIKYLNDVKYSFNSYTMNPLSILLGRASIMDDDYFKNTVGKIIATRERTKKELKSLGFEFPDSKSNFIFATHPRLDAKELFTDLKNENIFVRYFDKPRISNYVRITIGTDDEMGILIDFLKKYVKSEQGR